MGWIRNSKLDPDPEQIMLDPYLKGCSISVVVVAIGPLGLAANHAWSDAKTSWALQETKQLRRLLAVLRELLINKPRGDVFSM